MQSDSPSYLKGWVLGRAAVAIWAGWRAMTRLGVTPRRIGYSGRRARTEDGCQRQLCRVPARAARSTRPRHNAAYVRQDWRVLRRGDVRDGDEQHALPAGR